MRGVALDGTEDEAEATIQAMLREAQEARCNGLIPWGARVEAAFGPFVAVRIFENQGEFACQFLDAAQRYPPCRDWALPAIRRAQQVAAGPRPRDDMAKHRNTDAELSLQPIASCDHPGLSGGGVERESLFGTRTNINAAAGRDLTTVVYLPRVRYSRQATQHAHESGRAPHVLVTNTCAGGNNIGDSSVFAQRYGMHPEGFTFVRPHTRGQWRRLSGCVSTAAARHRA